MRKWKKNTESYPTEEDYKRILRERDKLHQIIENYDDEEPEINTILLEFLEDNCHFEFHEMCQEFGINFLDYIKEIIISLIENDNFADLIFWIKKGLTKDHYLLLETLNSEEVAQMIEDKDSENEIVPKIKLLISKIKEKEKW